MPLAKLRDWKPHEIVAAREYLLQQRPGLWEQLKEVQATTRDFVDLDITGRTYGLLRRLHPECEGYEISQLFSKLRDQMKDELGQN